MWENQGGQHNKGKSDPYMQGTEGNKMKAECHPPAVAAKSYQVSDSAIFEMEERDPPECIYMEGKKHIMNLNQMPREFLLGNKIKIHFSDLCFQGGNSKQHWLYFPVPSGSSPTQDTRPMLLILT